MKEVCANRGGDWQGKEEEVGGRGSAEDWWKEGESGTD